MRKIHTAVCFPCLDNFNITTTFQILFLNLILTLSALRNFWIVFKQAFHYTTTVYDCVCEKKWWVVSAVLSTSVYYDHMGKTITVSVGWWSPWRFFIKSLAFTILRKAYSFGLGLLSHLDDHTSVFYRDHHILRVSEVGEVLCSHRTNL